ncbi:MAG: hypothetical protein KDA24_09420 [Deltaproteobacteria bacterium]|nr:hypothetical protein [Deltaproteobacteria bacterium]
MEATRTLEQPTSWNPLDLTDESVPSITGAANDGGPGFLPDRDTRPELAPVDVPSTPRSE